MPFHKIYIDSKKKMIRPLSLIFYCFWSYELHDMLSPHFDIKDNETYFSPAGFVAGAIALSTLQD